jgi:hypothetical protein
MFRLSILAVLIFLAAMWFVMDVFTPLPQAQRLGGTRSAKTAETGPVLAPASAELRGRAMHTPLAVLVLDLSGSMVKLDKEFRETTASEIFSFFFAKLSRRDVPAAEVDRIHLALLFFPGDPSKEIAALEPWDGRPWCQVARGLATFDADMDVALNRISSVLDRRIGHPGGQDKRNGGTPHAAAITACDKVIEDYRREVAANADVFVMYFTDGQLDDSETVKLPGRGAKLRHLAVRQAPGFVPGVYEVASKSPGVEVTFALLQNEAPHVLIDRFLRALRLEAFEDSAKFTSGFPTTEVNQPLPLVIRTKTGFFKKGGKPTLVTDRGEAIALRGSGDTFYTLLDPSDAALRNANSLRLEGNSAKDATVTLYRRAQWLLSITPPVFGMLDQQQRPEVRLQFTGKEMPQIGPNPIAKLEDESGAVRHEVQLAWDASRSLYAGSVPEFTKLLGRDQYFARWDDGEGGVLRYPLRVTTDFDLRFVDQTNQKTGREIRGVRVLPRR